MKLSEAETFELVISLVICLIFLVIAVGVGYQYLNCDGTMVRTMFGFECIYSLKGK